MNNFLILISNKMWVIRAGTDKMLVRIANREYLDQTADQCLNGLSGLFGRQLVFKI